MLPIYTPWPPVMPSQSDIERFVSRGTSSGELIESPELIVNLQQVELHSYFSTLLEIGLAKLLTLHPRAATLVIELVAGADSVIFAKQYSLSKDFTLIAQDVAVTPSPTITNPSITMHWRLQINYGN